MANLLEDRELRESNRFFGNKNRDFQQPAVIVLISATEPKDLFEATRRQSSRDNFTANLSRSVFQNPWQLSRRTWPKELGGLFDEIIEYVEVIFAEQHVDEDDDCQITHAFLDNANRLDQLGQTDRALDIIFDQIDEMLLAGEFNRVDQILADIMPGGFSVELLLGILTVTLPAKNQLPKRASFFGLVRQSLLDRGTADDRLLVGLD